MSMILKVGGSVTPGNHVAAFLGFEPHTNTLGTGLKWKFEVPEKGKVSRITQEIPKATNSAGRILGGVLGRPFQQGESVDLAPFVGKKYLITVAQTPKGLSSWRASSPSPPDPTAGARRCKRLALALSKGQAQ